MKNDYFHRVAKLTPAKMWINNVTREEAGLAIAAGAMGCTQNPSSPQEASGRRMKYTNKLKRGLFLIGMTFTGYLLQNCTSGDKIPEKVFPTDTWEERSPEEMGVDPSALLNAVTYLDENSGGVGTDEMVVVRNGYIIWKGAEIDNWHELFSATKTFTSTVLGVLVTDGILSVDDLAVDYYPELDDGDEGQEAYNQIRFRDFATMTAGYNSIVTDCWELHMKGLHDESYACTQKYTIPGKPEYTPRCRWNYDDQNVHMLGYILTKIAGKSLEEVFKTRVSKKIGMVDWDWSDYGYRDGMFFNNPAGTPNNIEATEMNEVQSGIYTTALEFARYGLLYLNNGNWDGQQILDSAFTEMAISNQVPSSVPPLEGSFDLSGRYGFYWWTNGVRSNGTRPWPSAPPKTATPHGGGRNFCFVVPEWDMVIVRMSPRCESPMPEHGDKIWEGFFERIKTGIK